MKEPSFSRRKRPTTTTSTAKKLKLVCSFNGAFQLRPPSGRLRYVGGETRIVSVDRNIGFSKLRSKISDLCPKTPFFTLKYHLAAGTPLVSVAGDDDVRCMIEEYDKVEACGKHARLWVYVCNSGSDNNGYNDNGNDSDNGFVKDCGNTREREGFGGCGVKVVGKNGVGEFSLRKMVLKQQLMAKQGFLHCFESNNFDVPLVGLVSGPAMKCERASRFYEDPCGVNVSDYGVFANAKLARSENFGNLGSHVHPLNPRDGNLRVEMSERGCGIGNNVGSGGARQFPRQLCDSSMIMVSRGGNSKQDLKSVEPSMYMNNLNRENIVPWSSDCLAPPSCSNLHIGSAYSSKFSCIGERPWEGPQSGIRNHRFGMSDARNQRWCSQHVRSNQSNLPEVGNNPSSRLDGRPWVGKYYPGLRLSSNISKQGQSMRSCFSNSWKPLSSSQVQGSQGICRMMDSGLCNHVSSFGLQYGEENIREEQVGLAVPQYGKPNPMECQLGHHRACTGMSDQSFLPCNVVESTSSCVRAMDTQAGSNSVKHEVPLVDLYGDLYGLPIRCKPIPCDVEKEPFVMKPQEVFNIPSFPNEPGYSNGSELGCDNKLSDIEAVKSSSDHRNDTHTLEDKNAAAVDISLYNLSLSSSKMEPPPLSSLASSDVSEALLRPQSKPLDLRDEGQGELLNSAASNSSSHNATQMEKDCVHKEKIQQDPPNLSNDEKVDIKKSHNSYKVIGGVSKDLTAFYTHLVTRELQTIKNSDLEYIKELGSGTYGTVFYGKWKGSDVAIKRLKQSCFKEGALEEDRLVADFWKEAHILGQLHHPNIVAFYGVVTDGPITNLATVTEYMVNGSLKQVLRRKDRTIDRRKRLIIAMDAAFGMEYLHEKNIVHFDLKSHNFLVNMRDPQRPVCKIGDLGLSKIKQRTLVSGGVRGTIPWMAPELLSCKNNMVTEKVDVYSFGIVMWELLTGEEPYGNLRSEEVIAGIIKGNLRPEIPSWCDPAWRSLMERCWSSDPDSRPAFSEIAKELRAMSAGMNIK